MTSEEAKDFLTKISYTLGNMSVEYLSKKDGEKMREAIKSLEQDTVPFDLDLYQAGLMDMPKGMIEVLDKIKTEIETDLFHFCFDEWGNENPTWKEIKAIIDKYKSESEVKE